MRKIKTKILTLPMLLFLFTGCGAVLLDGEIVVSGEVVHVSVDCSQEELTDLEISLCEQAIEDQ